MPVEAATYTWTGVTDGLWTTTSNWSLSGTPVAADNVVFNSAGNGNTTIDLSGTTSVLSLLFDTSSAAAYTLGSGGAGVQTLQLANSGSVSMASTVANDELINALLVLGTDASAGSYTLSNNSLTKSLTFAGGVVGGSGGTAGLKTLSLAGAGNMTLSGLLGQGGATQLAISKTGTGTARLTGGSLSSTGTMNVGGGVLYVTPTSPLTITSATMSSGTLRLSGTAITVTNKITDPSGGTILIDDSAVAAPSVTFTNGLTVSEKITSQSFLLNVNNATLTTPGLTMMWGRIVLEGTSRLVTTAAINQGTGDRRNGLIVVKDMASISGTGQDLLIGSGFTQQNQTFRIQDGAQASFRNVSVLDSANYTNGLGHQSALTVSGSASLAASGTIFVVRGTNDQNGTGTLYASGQIYQTGGSVTAVGGVSLNTNDRASGTGGATHVVQANYVLAGGTLGIGGRILGGATRTGVGQSFVSFRGGTLMYTGTTAQSDFINLTATVGQNGVASINNLRVYEGGTIDTGTQSITIAQPILAASGSGIGSISVTGYTSQVYSNDIPPQILITGGGGSGAAAIAVINASGNLSGITITNPGSDYTSAPTVQVVWPTTAQTIAAGNVTLASNAIYSGGITKRGSGTLILTASNNYTGNTRIGDGTLSLGNVNALAASTLDMNADDAGSLAFTVAGTNTYNIGGLIGSRNIATSGSVVLSVGANATSGTYSGSLSGQGAFTKVGVGSLTLSGFSSYGGGTRVEAGTLRAGNVSAFGTGGIVLLSGATLDLNSLPIANTITNNGGSILNALGFTGTTVLSSGTTSLANIGGTVDIDASAVADLSGTINAEVTVKAGGRGRALGQIKKNVTVSGGAYFDILNDATIDDAASFSFTNNGQIHIDRASAITLSKVISGTGGLRKSGNSRVTLTGNNSFTGATQIDAGALIVNGALASDVVVGSGATLGGSGVLGDILSGAGTISVGNSPGIGTAASVDPTLGTDWVFEITGTAPTWNAGGSASVNDVLRLTDATPFLGNLTAANVVDVLFNLTASGPISEGTYLGGFYADQSNFSTAIANGGFEYWVLGQHGGSGDQREFAVGSGGSMVWYSKLSAYDDSKSVNVSVVQQSVSFDGTTTVNGYATQFVVVPEPGTVIFAGIGMAMVGWSLWKRRRIAS